MNEFASRLNELIAHLGIKKMDFASKVGVTAAYISQLSSGVRAPSDRTISDICREFRVNETWLRTGEGPMMHETDEDQEMEDIIASLVFTNTDRAEGIRAILRAYWKLPEEAKKAIDQLIDGMRR